MLVLFARKVNWHDIWHTMQDASLPILLAAAGVNLASIIVKGVRWWVFLRPVGARSLPLALRATFAGAGLNNVLVANGGEAARVVFVARAAHVPSARVLATLALERLFELVGYVVLRLYPRSARIYSLAVAETQRRRGVGGQLLNAAERYARAHGRERLTLEARYDNRQAIALYEKLGFRHFGRYPGYYDDGAEALRYEKVLERTTN